MCRGMARNPPDVVLKNLEGMNNTLQLGAMLCKSRNPDFLLDIIHRQVKHAKRFSGVTASRFRSTATIVVVDNGSIVNNKVVSRTIQITDNTGIPSAALIGQGKVRATCDKFVMALDVARTLHCNKRLSDYCR